MSGDTVVRSRDKGVGNGWRRDGVRQDGGLRLANPPHAKRPLQAAPDTQNL